MILMETETDIEKEKWKWLREKEKKKIHKLSRKYKGSDSHDSYTWRQDLSENV